MDSERFGRALGVGARAAAKTLVTAADAAASPNPRAKSGGQARTAAAPMKNADVTARVTQAAAQVTQAADGLNRGSQQFKRSVWGPVKRLSGVLWLEFTGVFFGLFALSAGSAAWKMRDAWHETPANHETHVKLLIAGSIALLFGYFCVSSFLEARSRQRAK